MEVPGVVAGYEVMTVSGLTNWSGITIGYHLFQNLLECNQKHVVVTFNLLNDTNQ
jgi:hypothetical protein